MDAGRVASFGSVNVDRMAYLDDGTLADLADRYDWFPGPGETVAVGAGTVPPAVEAHVDEVLPGGKGANQAVAAAAAGAGTSLLGAVGADDAAGFDSLGRLRRRGVDVSGVATVDAPTGTAYVFVAPDGENHIATVAGANARVDADYARRCRDRILGADVLLLQNEVPVGAAEAALDVVLEAREDRDGGGDAGEGSDGGEDADRPPAARGPTVILDPAPPAGAARLIAHPAVDVVTPNDPEHRAIADALAGFDGTTIRTRGPRPVVVEGSGDRSRRRVGGPDCRDADGGCFEVAPPTVEAVDTTGAGDVFDGYLAARLAAGEDLRAAVRVGTVAAALSTTAEGVQAATPDADRVAAFEP